MLLANKFPDPGKEKFKIVIAYGKNVKITFNCLKLEITVCFPVPGYVCCTALLSGLLVSVFR